MPESLPRSSVSADDWDKHWDDLGSNADGNPANLYRRRLIIGLLGPVSPGSRILDIGSGQGELAVVLQARFPDAEVRGIEYSAEGVRRARERALASGVDATFWQRDLLAECEVGPQDREWATHAVCSEVLEHVDDPAQLLRNASVYLAPGCTLVVTVPAGPRTAFDRHIGHRRHYTPALLKATLVQGGYNVAQIERAGAPFFNVYRLSVMLRGRRLIEDLSRSGDQRAARNVALAYKVFEKAFRYNFPSTPIGWQLVAVASPAPS